MRLFLGNGVVVDKAEIASYPEIAVLVVWCRIDYGILITSEGCFQQGIPIVQFVDMFEVVDVSPVVLVLEGDERTDNTFPFFSGDFVEFLFFQVILVDMVAQ